jgi:acetyl-CoA carboxylase carboxyl transferase subunit alpha
LWRSWEHKETAASALKLTSKDMKALKLVDEVIKEPLGGAHRDRETTFKSVAKRITAHYDELKKLSPEKLVENRIQKYSEMGEFKER